MITFEALLNEYREHLAQKYALTTQNLWINCIRRAMPANGGVVALLSMPADDIQFNCGRTANYRGQVRQAAVDFRAWADQVHPGEEIPEPAHVEVFPVPTAEDIDRRERCGPDMAAAIRATMGSVLSRCGAEAYRRTPDEIAEQMYPCGTGAYRSSCNKRSRVRRAVRLLQANYSESPKSCEVPA